MRIKALKRALALSLFSVVAALAVGCSCGSDEDDPVAACEKITAAVNKVLTGCGATAESDTSICGVVCGGGILHCSERTDVEVCTGAIEALGCGDAQGRVYEGLSECASIFGLMADSCSSPSGDGDDDFDD